MTEKRRQETHNKWVDDQFAWFARQHSHIPNDDTSFRDKCSLLLSRVQEMCQWFINRSWTHCKTCNCLLPNPWLPKNQILQRPLPTCACSSSITPVPTFDFFLLCFKHVIESDQQVLSFFKIQCEPYKRAKHGYRIKTSGIDAITKTIPIDDEIAEIKDKQRRNRLMHAFNFLMNLEDSHYADFFYKHQSLQLKAKYNFAQLFRICYIETALWPIWYFKDCLCESSIHQTANSKLSRKKHFLHKCLGQVLDYSQNFALLRFQYERWCYQIISGTIESGKKFGASSATSMDSKPICHTYWRWQHVILLDTVDQLGYPSLFVTITANEWEMSKPFWVTARSSVTGCAPSHDAFSETMQIVHALQQIIRGFMAGTTHKNWRQHLFANLRHRNRNNVKAYHYRIEFQKRGTPHVHALFWISDMRKLALTRLHSSLPNNNLNFAFQVSHLQQQRKPGRTNLKPNPGPTSIHPTNNTIEFHCTEEDCNLGLRTYSDELNLAFRSHHDIQSSDGHGLLLQYVSSYVTKTHDDAIGQSV